MTRVVPTPEYFNESHCHCQCQNRTAAFINERHCHCRCHNGEDAFFNGKHGHFHDGTVVPFHDHFHDGTVVPFRDHFHDGTVVPFHGNHRHFHDGTIGVYDEGHSHFHDGKAEFNERRKRSHLRTSEHVVTLRIDLPKQDQHSTLKQCDEDERFEKQQEAQVIFRR